MEVDVEVGVWHRGALLLLERKEDVRDGVCGVVVVGLWGVWSGGGFWW